MWRIKCSNGKCVKKTTYGEWVHYSKAGKIFTNINIARKNLLLCEEFAEKSERHGDLTYELEEI